MPVGKEEIYYSIKKLDDRRTAVTKFVDENLGGVYTQEGPARCDCIGCIAHKTQCKHLKIRAMWESLGRPHGSFTVDKKVGVKFHPYKESE